MAITDWLPTDMTVIVAQFSEKWQLAVACLQHFQMILSMYDIKEEDIDLVASQSQLSTPQSAPLQMQLPVVELLKDFMSDKIVFRNIMGIILLGVDAIIADRTNHTYGLLLEKAVLLCLDIIIPVLEKDLLVSDFWRPLYQVPWNNESPLDTKKLNTIFGAWFTLRR